MSNKLTKLISKKESLNIGIESSRLSGFNQFLALVSLIVASQVADVTLGSAQENLESSSMDSDVNSDSNAVEGSKSTHSQGLYLTGFGEAGEYMYTLKPGFEYQSDFLSPVSLNNVSLEVTLNYFAENPKPGQFEKVHLSSISSFSNGYLYAIYQTSVMMKAYGDFKFQIHGIDASLPVLDSGLYPTLVYSNDKLHIALGNYFEFFLNKRNYLFKMRYFDENRIEFSFGYNLNQQSGIYKQIESGYSFEASLFRMHGEYSLSFGVGIK